MKTIERLGNDIDEIIAQFKNENNLEDSDFTYEVIREPKKGFLGFIGSQKGLVCFRTDTIIDDITTYLRELAIYMQITIGQINIKRDKKYIYVNIFDVSEPGYIIGKDGRLMENLQYLLNQTFSQKDILQRNIILDIEGYKERQEQQIYRKVKQLAEQAIRYQKSITLEPMPASYRRIAHEVVRKYDNLKTMTIGEGSHKRVVLTPTNKRQRH